MKKVIMALPVALLFSAIGGCASSSSAPASYVSQGITVRDAKVLSQDAVERASQDLAAGKTTVVIAPSGNVADALLPALQEGFRSRGFGVAVQSDRQPAPTGTLFQYVVTPYSGGVLLRLKYSGEVATRLYYRSPMGGLVGGSPFTVLNGVSK